MIRYVLIDGIFIFIKDAHIYYVCLNVHEHFWNHLPETVSSSISREGLGLFFIVCVCYCLQNLILGSSFLVIKTMHIPHGKF